MTELNNGERQVAPTLAGIRRDHVARYEFAARLLGPGNKIIDLACGIGYGSAVLADAGNQVVGYDRSDVAIEYGRKHYAREDAALRAGDVSEAERFEPDAFDAAVCFETIEHLPDPVTMLRTLHQIAPRLIASVPNEAVFPHGGRILHHYRHYTRAQFAELLHRTGWDVTGWYGQRGPHDEVEPEVNGRTIVVVAERADGVTKREEPKPLKHVAIVGLGPSAEAFVDMTKRLGGRHAFCDEVWTINALGDVLQSDRVFHMDDVRIQEVRARARPESNIARMLDWMKRHPGPIYTSRPHPDYPGLVPFPIEEVINSCGFAYFNSTAAYAVAYAVHIGVEKLSVFGNDFTYPNAHDAEKGRGCVEFHLGIAAARGIEIGLPASTSLMDANAPMAERIYGYDTMDVEMTDDGERTHVLLTPHDRLPSADEIEARYDHSKHPNRLVKQ